MDQQAVTVGCAALLLGLLFISWVRTQLRQKKGTDSQGSTVRDTLAQVQDELGIPSGVGRSAAKAFDLTPLELIGALSYGKAASTSVREDESANRADA